MSPEEEASQIISTIRCELEQATDHILSATENGLRVLAAAQAGNGEDLGEIEPLLLAILQACTVQDIAGQRLAQLETLIGTTRLNPSIKDPLLNGPALTGEALGQDATDAIFSRGS